MRLKAARSTWVGFPGYHKEGVWTARTGSDAMSILRGANQEQSQAMQALQERVAKRAGGGPEACLTTRWNDDRIRTNLEDDGREQR